MGRSRGGLTMKIHALVDADGLPIKLKLTEARPMMAAPPTCWRRSTMARSCSPVAPMTQMRAAQRWPHAEPDFTSSRCPTARRRRSSTANSTAHATASNASSTSSNISAPLPPATTSGPTTSSPQFNSRQSGSGCALMSLWPTLHLAGQAGRQCLHV